MKKGYIHSDWMHTKIRVVFHIAGRSSNYSRMFNINIVSNLITAKKFKSAMKNILRLKNKIKSMRRAGLEGPRQEFSIENIAFKRAP